MQRLRPTPITPIDKAKVGDYVTFGLYEQDNNEANGAEAIEKDGCLLVIGRYALDCQQYHHELDDVV